MWNLFASNNRYIIGEGLRIMDAEPERFQRLRDNCKMLHTGLVKALKGTKFDVIGFELSPIQHVFYRDDDRKVVETKLDSLVENVSCIEVLFRWLFIFSKSLPYICMSVSVCCP